MAKNFANLFNEPSNITEVMSGPWNDIRIEKIAPGENLQLTSNEVEHACFVISGEGNCINADELVFPLAAQDAFALPAGGSATIEAAEELTVLHIEMKLTA